MKIVKKIFGIKFKSTAMLIQALVIFNIARSQVVINENDAAGNTSAALDIQSTTKGVLFPVMTDAERQAIKSPATGLLIFNRSSAGPPAGGYFCFYDGTNWIQIDRTIVTAASNPGGSENEAGVGVGVADPDNSSILHVNSVTKGFLLPRMANSPASPTAGLVYYKSNIASNQLFFYNGSAWAQISSTVLDATIGGGAETAAGLLIGSGTIAPSAKMEINSSTTGLLLPRMTDAQRDAIPSPAEGLTIYNTTSGTVQYYCAATWYQWSSGVTDYGQVIGNPGLSCKDIYDNNPGTVGSDGNGYYIDPDGVGGNAAYQCYCDMTRDGGGWTLVLNSGPKGSSNLTTTAVGAMPLSNSAAGSNSKLSDADINLLRGGAGGYATSILKIERQNNNNLTAVTKIMYVVQNKIFKSNATNLEALNSVALTYADALVPTVVTSSTVYASAINTWGLAMPNQIIFSYNAEGFITNNTNTACAATNRSECSVLLWVKLP